MFVGVISDPEPFQNLCGQMSPDIFKWIGVRADPHPKGKVCERTIYLFLPNKEELVVYIKYGSDSMGPPTEVSQLVIATVELTGPWYEEFKAGVVNQQKQVS